MRSVILQHCGYEALMVIQTPVRGGATKASKLLSEAPGSPSRALETQARTTETLMTWVPLPRVTAAVGTDYHISLVCESYARLTSWARLMRSKERNRLNMIEFLDCSYRAWSCQVEGRVSQWQGSVV